MHGRPREFKHKLKDPKVAEAYRRKVDTIRDATALVLDCRKQQRYDEAALAASAKLLKVVPEIYTVWNYRREALKEVFEKGGDEAAHASEGELALTQACILENPKSYSSWHHRKWVVSQGYADLYRELKIISKALDEDQRNFHAWDYRQFVVQRMARPAADELAYSEEKIYQNFSNYSAWHYRSVLLPRVHCRDAPTDTSSCPEEEQQEGADESGAKPRAGFTGTAAQSRPLPMDVLDEEYEMMHNAFATDSRDQSPWLYYMWLLGNSLAHASSTSTSDGSESSAAQQEEATRRLKEVLAREVRRFQEDHLAQEPDAKWPLLTVARIKEAQVRLGLSEGEPGAPQAEVEGLYRRLQALDPLRSGFYQDALEGRAPLMLRALGSA